MNYTPFKLAVLATACLATAQLYAQPWDPAMKPGTPIRSAPPSGLGITTSVALGDEFSQAFNSDYQRLGWQYDLFKTNVPLAWNVTKEKQDIVVAIGNRDFQSPAFLDNVFLQDPEYEDVVWRKYGQTNGNFFLLSQDFRAANHPLATYSNGDGTVLETYVFALNAHGFSALSLAVAQENNIGMVGVAPQASAFVTNVSGSTAMYKTDVDGLNNNVIKVPDVESISLLVDEEIIKDDIAHGTVIVGAAGNSMLENGDISGTFSSSCGDVTALLWRAVGPKSIPPANLVYEDLDTKVIAVGNVDNGTLMRPDGCGLYWDGLKFIFGDHKNHQSVSLYWPV